MIALFTDFSHDGPYLGQMKAALLAQAPRMPIVDLMVDVPAFNVKAAAYLLAAVSAPLPQGTTFICVVDPGVGSVRRPIAVSVDDCWFVGPDNGLFNLVSRSGNCVRWFEIKWRPERLSDSFHGRDLFAPVAARLAAGKKVAMSKIKPPADYCDWHDDLPEIIYIDGYGNCVTGLRVGHILAKTRLVVAGKRLSYTRTFAEAKIGRPFWYENSMGLIEIAINQGSAAALLKLEIGDQVKLPRNTT